jgi:hypothetical protein
MADDKPQGWIDDLEIPDAQIKWAWSHFDGRADTYNDEGDHNFQIIIPQEDVPGLLEMGWSVSEREGLEEGDPPQYLLKAKISYRFSDPMIFLIKNGRKFRAKEVDLQDIRRGSTEQIDVILSPSRWVNGPRAGVTAYVKEMYVQIRESRFAAEYSDLEEV